MPRSGQLGTGWGLRDHHIGVVGGWQNKSESPGPADQGNLTIEWTADL
jgi:hypothetical protein